MGNPIKRLPKSYKLSIFSADCSSSSFRTSAYIFKVVCISACPNRSDIVLISTYIPNIILILPIIKPTAYTIYA